VEIANRPQGSDLEGSSAWFVRWRGACLDQKPRLELLAEWHGNPGKVSSDTLYPSIKDYPGVKGEYVIHADLGNYQGVPFRVGIDAFWGFDAAGRLVDLRVRKVHEGL